MIPYGKQSISQQDIDAVVSVLNSDWLTQGPKVPAFEKAVTELCQAKHGVAVNSATSALHIANLALGVGENDIVWTSPISFVASANCALYCGAKVDFVDIELSSGNMSVDALKKKLVWAKEHNCLPKVVIPVHLAGQSCDMKAIASLAKEYHFNIIEDASHAIGGKYNQLPIGSCQFSDITVFSFHPVKIVTSAEGGMSVTNDTNLANKMRRFRSHGITSNNDEMTEPSHGPWYYQQVDLGFNYRMTDLHAALGLSQLSRLHDFVATRNELAQRYDNAFASSNVTPLKSKSDCLSSYHLYLILLPKQSSMHNNTQAHKDAIIHLRDKGICAHVHYIPVHLQPYYTSLGFAQGDFPNAEEYYSRVVTLPLHPLLLATEQEYIIEQVKGL
ncbi:MAG: UDP-4-amino-4,6-dideoxy-N-acetyl-beta-L-altrosamine transaminase [Colwellia sp.]